MSSPVRSTSVAFFFSRPFPPIQVLLRHLLGSSFLNWLLLVSITSPISGSNLSFSSISSSSYTKKFISYLLSERHSPQASLSSFSSLPLHLSPPLCATAASPSPLTHCAFLLVCSASRQPWGVIFTECWWATSTASLLPLASSCFRLRCNSPTRRRTCPMSGHAPPSETLSTSWSSS